ncbi:unnamed protein product [Toxocara canis]|uniref:Uncharacterized protein n=1 Tax=Toxocara canis TaxID=6265 RepID=A0A183U9W2_TOXCA|nr:unnamed protein product [Toxocara canis]
MIAGDMAGVKRSRGAEDCSQWYGPKFMGLWKRYEAAAAWMDIHRQAVHAARAAESDIRSACCLWFIFWSCMCEFMLLVR